MKSHIYTNPSEYNRNNSLQYNFAMKLLRRICLIENGRILDIGCGDGTITNEIAAIVKMGCIIGTDISPRMVDFAASKFRSQANLRFLQMDAARNFFREQFDIIVSFNCLHWVSNQQEALNGIGLAAIPGAQVALLLSHRKSLYHHVLDKLCSSSKWSNYFKYYENPRSFYDVNNYKDMLVKAGLDVVELVEEEMIYTFKSKGQLKDFFSAAGSQIKQIPESKKNEFLTDFVNLFLDQCNCENDELLPVGFWCLQVLAKKPIPQCVNEKKGAYQPRIYSRL